MASDDLRLNMYFVLTRGRHYLALATPYRLDIADFPTPFHLTASFGVTPSELMEKLYDS